jgi:dihydrofolate reductase
VATRTAGSEVRAGETGRWQRRHRAPARPYDRRATLFFSPAVSPITLTFHLLGRGKALGAHPGRPDSRSPAAMSLSVCIPNTRSTALEESIMTATYTFDVFSSLDGFGAHSGNWGGYWGKQGPELLDHRLALYGEEQRMVFGANTYRAFVRLLASSTEESEVGDPWVTRMRSLPATVVSTTLEGPLDWPDATVVRGDAVDVVARLKEESEVPLRSHGSLSLNRALLAAGLVDRVQVTLFPVITGQTGVDPIFQGAADFDLELIESRTLDGHTQELIYRPTLHV